jgi:hypothetical protein
MTKTFLALVLAATLAGCSLFAKPSNNYTRPSGTEDQTSADLNSCRQQADAEIGRDASIDNDISAARSDQVDPNQDTGSTIVGADDYQREKRHRQIINDCMRQRGYVLPEKNGLF